MNEEEIRRTLSLLSQAGLEAQLCDIRVPVSSVGVKCGVPTALGDAAPDGYIMLPKALVGTHPEILVPAVGDSMTGANIEEGDLLRVRLGMECRDGDNVLAWIDGSCTVKTYFSDEEGMQWLVPQNEAYDAILITGEYDVQILGCVVGVEKSSPRAAFSDCQKYVKRAKTKMKVGQLLSPTQIDNVLRAIGPEVKHARQWYAVFRALIDYQKTCEYTIPIFCTRLAQVLPGHRHLPVPRELQRMAVQSFSKPVALWSEVNAPVSGIRFSDYLRIARLTSRLLEGEQSALPF